MFNTVPIARNGGGLGNGARDHVDKLIQERWNLLIFPEGTRSRDGQIGEVRSGAAVIAAAARHRHRPDLRQGTHDGDAARAATGRSGAGGSSPRRHRVEVHFGAPIWPGRHRARAARSWLACARSSRSKPRRRRPAARRSTRRSSRSRVGPRRLTGSLTRLYRVRYRVERALVNRM